MGMNTFDRNAGFAAGQRQVWGFDKATGIDSKSYLAPGAKIFYVDPNNAQATDFGNLGEDPTVPLATVQAAVTLCRDHMGDTIVVGANDAWQYSPHNRPLAIIESVIVPSGKGGIKIIGAGTNPFGVQWEAAADNQACLSIYAMDVLVDGFGFYEDGKTGTTGILCDWNGTTRNGENLTVRNCSFFTMTVGISLDYAWLCQFYSNYFAGCATAILNVSTVGDAGYLFIHDNIFHENPLALSLPGALENHVYNNRIFGDPTGAANYIDFTGGIDNMVADNWLACTLAQYAVTCVDGAGDIWVRNHCSDGDTIANP